MAYTETALPLILSFPSKTLPNYLANTNGPCFLKGNARILGYNLNRNSQRTSGYSLGSLGTVIFLFLTVMKDSVFHYVILFIILPSFLFFFFFVVVNDSSNGYLLHWISKFYVLNRLYYSQWRANLREMERLINCMNNLIDWLEWWCPWSLIWSLIWKVGVTQLLQSSASN